MMVVSRPVPTSVIRNSGALPRSNGVLVTSVQIACRRPARFRSSNPLRSSQPTSTESCGWMACFGLPPEEMKQVRRDSCRSTQPVSRRG